MQIGMVGLGRMGANMVRRLLKQGHDCVVFDVNLDNVAALVKEGAVGATSPDDLVAKLSPPRAVWLMLPAAITPKIARDFAARLQAGDAIISAAFANPPRHPLRAAPLAPTSSTSPRRHSKPTSSTSRAVCLWRSSKRPAPSPSLGRCGAG